MKFWKYHGLGNDFLIVEARDAEHLMTSRRAKALCDRRRGIGADGILIIDADPALPTMRVINADGSHAEMCGNGLRCVVRYLRDHHVGFKRQFGVQTGSGILDVQDDGEMVQINMGLPADEGHRTIKIGGIELRGRLVHVGNPHFVLFGQWANSDVAKLGRNIEGHHLFPEGVNVSFATLAAPSVIELKVWERGCGLTQACGTGACATAYTAWRAGHSSADRLVVELPGGSLNFKRETGAITMIGSAQEVFSGEVNPQTL